jgi:hypothetical protein
MESLRTVTFVECNYHRAPSLLWQQSVAARDGQRSDKAVFVACQGVSAWFILLSFVSEENFIERQN